MTVKLWKKRAPAASVSNEAPPASALIPRHVAVIMDGNGRWARAHGLPRTAGHRKGADAAQATVESCIRHGVSYLTLYAFSAENWQRPAEEVSELMRLLSFYLDNETQKMHENGIRLRVIGERSTLPDAISNHIAEAEQLTCDNTRLHLTVALSYGGRQEIVHACKALADKVAQGEIALDDINAKAVENALYDNSLPEVDLLIRTGGEQRISNFLLWQSAYAELYFTPTLWPEFGAAAFQEAIHSFQNRERRFGRTQPEATHTLLKQGHGS